MNQKEILKQILSQLVPELEKQKFLPKSKEQGFLYKGHQSIFFNFFLIYNRSNIKTGAKGFLIEPYIHIHNLEIEQFYKEITLNKELKTEWNFVTIGNSVANLKANPSGINRHRNQSLDLFIFSEQDINFTCNQLLVLFEKIALPYFNSHDSIKSIDLALNKHPTEYCVHMPNDLFRYIKGIIGAKLNDNPRVMELLILYKNLIIKRNMPKNCLEEMERLESILHLISKNKLHL